jgi:hypothetical protein
MILCWGYETVLKSGWSEGAETGSFALEVEAEFAGDPATIKPS